MDLKARAALTVQEGQKLGQQLIAAREQVKAIEGRIGYLQGQLDLLAELDPSLVQGPQDVNPQAAEGLPVPPAEAPPAGTSGGTESPSAPPPAAGSSADASAGEV
jgi:hypothetical protein